MRAWEKGGLLAPSWKDGQPFRLWLNVIGHNIAVARLAWRLAGRLEGKLADVTAIQILEAALVHDAFKRREWEQTQEAKRSEEWAEKNRQAELANIGFLRNCGFEQAVISLACATGDVGLEAVRLGTTSLGQKIVFYADNCVSGDKIVGYRKRFDDLLPEFEPGGRYQHVDAAYQVRYGQTHRQIWDAVNIPLQEKLAQLIGFSEPGNLFRLAFD